MEPKNPLVQAEKTHCCICVLPICLLRMERKEEAEDGPGRAGEAFAVAAMMTRDLGERGLRSWQV